MAGFAYYQWLKLEWPIPDFVIPIRKSETARTFAELMGAPCLNALRRVGWPLIQERWEIRGDWSLEETRILLFDEGCSLKQLQLAARAVQDAFPKKAYLLSLLA
jgi:hypothetical protein